MLRSGVVNISSCPDRYPFISTDLNCDADPHESTLTLRQKTETIVSSLISSKKVDRVSVFYRDLNNRQWFGINENDVFAPGSLLKLPLAIAYYKLAEVDQNILSLKNKYIPPTAVNAFDEQYLKPEKELEPNMTYTVEEMIERMIEYSDNAPVAILMGGVDVKFVEKVYIDLGLRLSLSEDENKDFVSVKTQSAMLRTLFNASYLNQFYSNKLLEIMSQSTFRKGIVAGIPEGVKVANKFGERLIVDPVTKKTTKIELHDCGTVYQTDSPYILCVMTQGNNYENLVDVIARISKNVYENR